MGKYKGKKAEMVQAQTLMRRMKRNMRTMRISKEHFQRWEKYNNEDGDGDKCENMDEDEQK